MEPQDRAPYGDRLAAEMATTGGRVFRIVVGSLLIVAGLLGIGGVAGFILALLGVAPVVEAIADRWVLAPLLHAPVRAAGVRRRKRLFR